jgi:hypothetical protein
MTCEASSAKRESVASVVAWSLGELPLVPRGVVLAGTGHRPQRLGAPWPASRDELERLAEDALRALRPSRVVSGVALGWDLALAAAAQRVGVPVTAAVPFGYACRVDDCEQLSVYEVRSKPVTYQGRRSDVHVFRGDDGLVEASGDEMAVALGPPSRTSSRQWQGSRWSLAERCAYLTTLKACDEVVVVSLGGYAPQKMLGRNRWMVARCDAVLALWSGSAGGTSACVADAVRAGKTVINLWEAWRAKLA